MNKQNSLTQGSLLELFGSSSTVCIQQNNTQLEECKKSRCDFLRQYGINEGISDDVIQSMIDGINGQKTKNGVDNLYIRMCSRQNDHAYISIKRNEENKIQFLQKDEKKSSHISDNDVTHYVIFGDNITVLKELQKKHSYYYDFIEYDIYYDVPAVPENIQNIYKNQTGKFGREEYLSHLYDEFYETVYLSGLDGELCVHCDTKLLFDLKKILDSLFGASKFYAPVARITETGGGFTGRLKNSNDWILIYTINPKHRFQDNTENESKKIGEYSGIDEFFEERGGYRLDYFDKRGNARSGKSDEYTYDIVITEEDEYLYGVPQGVYKVESGKRHSAKKDGFRFLLENGFIVVKNGILHKKCYWYVDVDIINQKIIYKTQRFSYNSLSLVEPMYRNAEGNKDLQRIFPDINDFTGRYDKPVQLPKTLIKMFTDKKDIKVLTMCNSTGSIGQAVVEMNKEDGGTRECTMVCNDDILSLERMIRVTTGHDSNGNTIYITKGIKNKIQIPIEPTGGNIEVYNVVESNPKNINDPLPDETSNIYGHNEKITDIVEHRLWVSNLWG